MTGGLLTWLRASWDSVRASLWFVPGLMFALGVALALILLGLDRGAAGAEHHWLIDSGDTEDARDLVSTLLGAIIAMASMVFSVTVVALSLAASAYGPRLIRLFRADLRTQVVLGTFLLTIVYLLIVRRSFPAASEETGVPHLSVFAGTLLGFACVFALLAFIQGVAKSIVADEVVRRVTKEFDAAVGQLPPVDPQQRSSPELPPDFEARAARLRLPRDGYVQAVEYEELVEWAATHDRLVRLDFRPGDFVVQGDRKVLVYPAPADEDLARKQIDSFIVSGQERTPTQDIEFAIRHLVEVAVRALSPGINDPFTAVAVIDRLRSGLCRLVRRQLPPPALHDGAGALRVVRHVTTFGGAVDAALNQIRQAGAAHPAVMIQMLKALGAISEHCCTPEQRHELARHAKLVRAAAEREIPDDSDRADVDEAFRTAIAALESTDRECPVAV